MVMLLEGRHKKVHKKLDPSTLDKLLACLEYIIHVGDISMNHLAAKIYNLNFVPLEIVSHYRDPQLKWVKLFIFSLQ